MGDEVNPGTRSIQNWQESECEHFAQFQSWKELECEWLGRYTNTAGTGWREDGEILLKHFIEGILYVHGI